MPQRRPPRKIISLIENVRRLKALIKEGTTSLKGDKDIIGLEEQLVQEFKTLGIDKISVQLEDAKVLATLVEATTEELDEEALEKLLGDRWDGITRTVTIMDRDLLQDAIARGDITPNEVAACSTTKPKKPYVLITDESPAKKEARKDKAPALVRAGRAKSAAAKKMAAKTGAK